MVPLTNAASPAGTFRRAYDRRIGTTALGDRMFSYGSSSRSVVAPRAQARVSARCRRAAAMTSTGMESYLSPKVNSAILCAKVLFSFPCYSLLSISLSLWRASWLPELYRLRIAKFSPLT